GQATFAGFIRLDDTATWLNIIDHAMSHARAVSGELPSTYTLVYTGDVGPSYPLGAFMLPGVARAIVGVNMAWVFQPFLACCGAALALCLYSLMAPLVRSVRLRALLAFAAAQPALLYGYSLWGGIKELTAAFLLALGVTLGAALLSRRPRHWRELLPLALAAGALIQTLGPGAAGWVAPALVAIIAAWRWLAPGSAGNAAAAGEARARTSWRSIGGSLGWLVALTAAFVVPVWVVLSDFFGAKGVQIDQLFSSGQSTAVKLGNLIHPLSGFQLGGIWPVHDFRHTAPPASASPLLALVGLAALGGIWAAARRRQFGPALYVAIALCGCGI